MKTTLHELRYLARRKLIVFLVNYVVLCGSRMREAFEMIHLFFLQDKGNKLKIQSAERRQTPVFEVHSYTSPFLRKANQEGKKGSWGASFASALPSTFGRWWVLMQRDSRFVINYGSGKVSIIGVSVLHTESLLRAWYSNLFNQP